MKKKHSGDENALPVIIRRTCPINSRFPADDEIDMFEKNQPMSDIDLKFLEPITNILTANAKKLEWETITIKKQKT